MNKTLANRSKNIIIPSPPLGLLFVTEIFKKIIAWLKLIQTNGYTKVEKYVKKIGNIKHLHYASSHARYTYKRFFNLSFKPFEGSIIILKLNTI